VEWGAREAHTFLALRASEVQCGTFRSKLDVSGDGSHCVIASLPAFASRARAMSEPIPFSLHADDVIGRAGLFVRHIVGTDAVDADTGLTVRALVTALVRFAAVVSWIMVCAPCE
jgi:hypothetical protein